MKVMFFVWSNSYAAPLAHDGKYCHRYDRTKKNRPSRTMRNAILATYNLRVNKFGDPLVGSRRDALHT